MMTFKFGEAIDRMVSGNKRVQRAGWNGKGMFIWLQRDAYSLPYYVMCTATGEMQPGWNASTADTLAADWQEVNGP